MLYFESGKGGEKNSGSLIAVTLLLFSLFLAGCSDIASHPERNLTLDAFKGLKVDKYALNSQLIRENLEHICRADHDGSFAATRVKTYYTNGGKLLWIGYQGVDGRADTLVNLLIGQLPAMGFSERAFRTDEIAEDVKCLRTLHLDAHHVINQIIARLEYNLTKSYMRYVIGQRFGFTNPHYLLNRLDPSKTDSSGRILGYRQLFDVAMDHPNDNYFKKALSCATSDSLGNFLRGVETTDSFYHELKRMIPGAGGVQRQRLLVNMERRRWREHQRPKYGDQYVVVNIPAYHLWGEAPDTVIDMRAACGAAKTKTPLLTSAISYMQVNPEWTIPMSIVRDDIAHHAGDSSYFLHRNYYIAERKTGRRMPPDEISYSMLCSGSYKVVQEGGKGNALGRIIFRFPNNFSVFLHDTSSPGVFERSSRDVSHGCVRVQRPFDLACFLMNKDTDEWEVDKLRISMGLSPKTNRGARLLKSREQDAPTPRLVNYIGVSPHIPIYICYYTLFRSPDRQLRYYPDVYGYDKVIGDALKPLMK